MPIVAWFARAEGRGANLRAIMPPGRIPGMLKNLTRLIGGDPIRRQLDLYSQRVDQINCLEAGLQGLDDQALRSRTAELRARPVGTVLTCSALKRGYRERLRAASPGLRFVFMEIDPASARARIEARRDSHFFSPSLVASQFATLESPVGEPGVLRVDALASLRQLQGEVSAWLHGGADR